MKLPKAANRGTAVANAMALHIARVRRSWLKAPASISAPAWSTAALTTARVVARRPPG